MTKQIFLAGCGRSGTTLLTRLMGSYEDTFAYPEEAPISQFDQIDRPESVHVVKRTWSCHETLYELPANLRLVYSVRHPLDTLTSRHTVSQHVRPYHVKPQRWTDEYRGLRKLERFQPERRITFVRYEDLVQSPDLVQQRIAASLGLEIRVPFSEMTEIFTTSIGRWHQDQELREHIYSLRRNVRTQIERFCARFVYELPADFVIGGERAPDNAPATSAAGSAAID